MPGNVIQDPELADPREAGRHPPYQQEKIQHPGTEEAMPVKPDHGEESYRGSGRPQGRVALITGGDSGIGRAVAIAFAREGGDVAIGYLPEEEKNARETSRWVEQSGQKALRLAGDIRDERHCSEMVERVFEQFGKLDILVNNAGFQMTHDNIEEFSTEEFDRTYKTNVYAMFWLCPAAVPRMKPGSAILNTASIQAFDPSANLLAYASTKAAIVNFTKALSKTAMKGGNPREYSCARPGLDTVDTFDDASGKGQEIRAGYFFRTRGPARRDRTCLRFSCEQ